MPEVWKRYLGNRDKISGGEGRGRGGGGEVKSNFRAIAANLATRPRKLFITDLFRFYHFFLWYKLSRKSSKEKAQNKNNIIPTPPPRLPGGRLHRWLNRLITDRNMGNTESVESGTDRSVAGSKQHTIEKLPEFVSADELGILTQNDSGKLPRSPKEKERYMAWTVIQNISI